MTEGNQLMLPVNPHTLVTVNPSRMVLPLATIALVGAWMVKSGVHWAPVLGLAATEKTGTATAIERRSAIVRNPEMVDVVLPAPWFLVS